MPQHLFKRRCCLALALCLLTAFLVTTPLAAQDAKSLPAYGDTEIPEKEMAYLVGLCEGCHGDGGVSQRSDVPSLAGRSAEAIRRLCQSRRLLQT